VYPAQAHCANGMKCWNRFKASDPQRDHGEPAILAGITRELSATHGLDADRVSVAGHAAKCGDSSWSMGSSAGRTDGLRCAGALTGSGATGEFDQ
jgi:poly(3-hydroxybutyrate) depolymerase